MALTNLSTYALRGLLAACALAMALPAAAAPMHYEVYDAVSTHGLWVKPIKRFLGVSDHTFAIGDRPGHFVYDADTGLAKLEAIGRNADDYTIRIQLELKSRGQGVAGQGTAGPQYGGGPLPSTAITDNWTYFDLLDGSLTLGGFPNHDGKVIDISTYPNPEDTKPAQFGFYANWLDDDLGFSMWFDCDGIRKNDGGKDGHCGDVNVDLEPVNPMPEPSAALLFGLGCTVAGSFTRRMRGRSDDLV